MTAPAILLVLLAAGLCAGCGAADRAPDAAAVAERFHAALDGRDGAAACAELSEETAVKLAQQEHRPCQQAILDLELPTGDAVVHTSVYVTSASVSLLHGYALFLDEAADGWEISAAGCRPTAPDMPYDCELEG
ncbi:MAG: hypothetical protein H0T69_17635 [Thermoleophilaceae bacterium]|nr:hypothetical protein [Thermoleophilaceae bacterium]